MKPTKTIQAHTGGYIFDSVVNSANGIRYRSSSRNEINHSMQKTMIWKQ